MNSILIQNVRINDSIGEIAIRGNHIEAIGQNLEGAFDHIIDGTGLLAAPAFYNTHCHAAMTVFRGMADRLPLMDWLQNHIWPAEAKLDPQMVYTFSKLAILEMIRSGIVFFGDMYFFPMETIRAAEELGVRASIGMTVCDGVSKEMQARADANNREVMEREKDFSSRIQLSYAPHAIYTVTEESLKTIAQLSQESGRGIQIHVSETAGEVSECQKLHDGMTPVQYLDSLGVLTPRTIAAHVIHVTPEDVKILADRQVVIAHNPCSNFKLNSGLFHFRDLVDAGCQVTIGTDGTASNDSLSMFDEMKAAVFNARLQQNSAVAAGATEVYDAATVNAARALQLPAGELKPGKLADLILVDTNTPQMIGEYDWKANLVYAADTSCVHTVICDGKILMQDHRVPGETEILAEAKERFHSFKQKL